MMTHLPMPAGTAAWVVTPELEVVGPYPLLAMAAPDASVDPPPPVSALRAGDPITIRFLVAFPGFGSTLPWVRGDRLFFTREAAEEAAADARRIADRLAAIGESHGRGGASEAISVRIEVGEGEELVIYNTPESAGCDEPALLFALEGTDSEGRIRTEEAVRVPVELLPRVRLALEELERMTSEEPVSAGA
jgi:hypothetical protein